MDRRCARLAAVLPALVLLSLAVRIVPAQGNQWLLLQPTSPPSDRCLPGIALDTVRTRMVLFGGVTIPGGTQPYLADTWEWDGTSWVARSPAVAPSARATNMVFDEARQRVVLFGGEGPNLAPLGDTWEYDGTSWIQRFPANTPGARALCGIAYDSARHRTIVFGGRDGSGERNDTWEWDGTDWAQVVTGSAPGVRHGCAMAYDPTRQRVVLFAGGQNAGVLADTWEFDGSTWQQLSPTATPLARSQHELTFAPWLGGCVLTGGQTGGSAFADAWVWDGVAWAQLPVSLPVARRLHRTCLGPLPANLVVIGGCDCATCPSVADQYELRNATATYQPFGAGCQLRGGTAPTLGAAPGERPILGATSQMRLGNLPTGGLFLPVIARGLSNTDTGTYALPLDLSVIGMPGCWQLVSIVDLTIPSSVLGSGYADLGTTLPLLPVLAGLQFYAQAIVFYDPSGVALSNGLTATVGY